MSKEILNDKEYLKVTYSEERAPFGPYPSKLGNHIYTNFYGRPGKVLDIGCGRGEYLQAFSDLGMEPSGVDISPAVLEYGHEFDIKILNLEEEDLSCEDKFDFVFSKSVVEHMQKPAALVQAAYDNLKEDGVAVIMTPSWVHNYKAAFYIDHTHVTPFTKPSLRDIMEMAGFKEVEVYYFYQLPLLWRFPYLKFLSKLVSFLPLPYAPLNQVPWRTSNKMNKIVRFSKEVMLLAVAKK